MRQRLGWLSFWWWAVLTGIGAAVVIGVYQILLPSDVNEFGQQRYWQVGLFATMFRQLIAIFNSWLRYTLPFVLLIALAWKVGGLWKARWMRIMLPLLLLIVVGCYLAHRSGIDTALLFRLQRELPALGRLVISPVGLLAPLLVMLWVWWRLRRKSRPNQATFHTPAVAPRKHTILSPIWVWLGRAVRVIMFTAVLLLAAAYAVTLLASWILPAAAQRSVQKLPNVIFIMVDTLRSDHIGCYGYDLPTTPNIDALARESTRFSSAIAPASWTAWSVNSIFTSQYPDVLFSSHLTEANIGFQDISYCYGSPLQYATLAETLYEHGYNTNAVVSNPWLRSAPGNTQGYSWYDDAPSRLNNDCRNTSPAVTKATLDRLRIIKNDRFFMYAVYMDPHDPYESHVDYSFTNSSQDQEKEQWLPSSVTTAQRAERRDHLRRYNAEIAYTDHWVGELIAGLKQLDIYDNSLIVFFSDHGEEFREHGMTGHCKTVYQEVVSVPCMVKLPHQKTGRVVEGRFPLLDIYPSVLAYLRFTDNHLSLRGQRVNFKSILRCPSTPIFCATDSSAKCAILDDVKYATRLKPEKEEELFDLTTDPCEQHTILGKSKTQTDHLRNTLEEWDTRNKKVELQHALSGSNWQRMKKLITEQDNNAELKEILDSLGYINH